MESGGRDQVLGERTTGQPIAVDASSVYWVDWVGGSVWKVAVSGGPPTRLAAGQRGLRSIAVDDTYVYWPTECPADGTACAGPTMTVPINGGAIAPMAVGQHAPLSAAADLRQWSVFWGLDRFGGKVVKASAESPVPIAIAPGELEPYGIVVDSSHVYWFMGSCEISKIAIQGGPRVILSVGPDAPMEHQCSTPVVDAR